ncbi:MAG: class I SAM-dependent methyltransferase, partial [Actinomycetota bacterium]|nr:class I SAM-dependent methyltransferase [Actinomycetota bacterium]
ATLGPMTVDPAEAIAGNRRAWDQDSADYQRRHSEFLTGKPLAWGIWRVPEETLGLLGDVAGKLVLEYGCGGAQFSTALAESGAHAIGLDISEQQLRYAQRYMAERGRDVPLLQASAHLTPFRDEAFDIVFSDYGATTFVDPYLTVPEAARLLRPGGIFVFCTTSPLYMMCLDFEKDVVTESLQRPYFGMRVIDDGSEFRDYQIPHREWITLFRKNRLVVEELIETQPDEGITTTYEGRPAEWARRWPAENIWKVRKENI